MYTDAGSRQPNKTKFASVDVHMEWYHAERRKQEKSQPHRTGFATLISSTNQWRSMTGPSLKQPAGEDTGNNEGDGSHNMLDEMRDYHLDLRM